MGRSNRLYITVLIVLFSTCSIFSENLSENDFSIEKSSGKGKISIFDNPVEIEQRFGRPEEKIVNEEYGYIKLEYGHFRIGYFRDSSRIKNITILDATIRTKRGAYIGMSKEEVIRLYGLPAMQDGDDFSYTYIRQLKSGKVPQDFDLIFTFQGNTVITITLSADW